MVDGDATWREQVVAMLEKLMPAEICGVGTVENARQLLQEWRPELLVVDYELPDGNAYNVLGAVRELASYRPVVLVIGEGKPRADEAFNLPASGARAYLSKPFTPDDLREKVEECRQRLDPTHVLQENVGILSLYKAVRMTREVMIREALVRTGGKQSSAAKLLGISRQIMNYYYCKLCGTR